MGPRVSVGWAVGLYQFQLHFRPAGSIYIEGEWELRDAGGAPIDGWNDAPDRPPYQLHRLLGRRVASSEVSAPEWFALHFEGGDVLRVFDHDPHYESFEIEPGGIIV
jgi:hypothetical protein